jgi:hypothetical protein
MDEPPFASPFGSYDVLEKIESPSWNEQTRRVVRKRLSEIPARQFFDEREWSVAEAIAARIVPQPDRASPVPIVPFIDQKLHGRQGKGYRYADMPPAPDAWRRGLAAIDDESRIRFGDGFAELSDQAKDDILGRVQRGDVTSARWNDLPPARFFTVILLDDVVGEYYAHPAAWSEIGFGGPASPRGYVRLGFDQRDPWEAKERRPEEER